MRCNLAELLGTFFLVFTVLCTSTVSGVLAAVSAGTILVACVWLAAHVSGAHLNPAVTWGVYLRGGMSSLDLWCYWGAQLTGALLASVLALVLLPLGADAPSSLGSAAGSLAGPAAGTGLVAVMVVELLFSFAWVYVVLSVGASRRQEHNLFLGLAVGVVIAAGMLAVSAFSTAALDPAVAFGLGVDGTVGWLAVAAYAVAELAGGAAAAGVLSRAHA